VANRGVQVERRWPAEPRTVDWLNAPRDDLLLETTAGDGVFVQEHGPFTTYRRTVEHDGDEMIERYDYRLVIPWFSWFFASIVHRRLTRRTPPTSGNGADGARVALPFWAPPDRLTPHQVSMLGLLAAASMTSAFVNTLFTQTVAYAGDDFGIGDWGRGVGGTVVRLGIVLAIPLALTADRIGRRRVIVATAWAAPIVSALGALAPSFPILVATQAVGRPLGLALDLLIMVVAAEEMPRNTRAYAVSILAMASGFGASFAVMSLPVADLADGAWRFSYLLALVWLVIARDLTKRLPETRRFEVHRAEIEQHQAPPMRRGRLAVQCAVAFCGNLIVAPASFFQNGYLKDERGYAGILVTLFTLTTALPAVVGLVLGGRIADQRGRKLLAASFVPLGAVLITVSFGVSGLIMWIVAALGGVVVAAAYPALAVYRAELFPTGHRSLAGALILASALVGGSVGLLLAGGWLDSGVSHVETMARLLIGPAIVSIIVLTTYPETAHRELEDINPEDRFPRGPGAT
jgi:MFS family permease